MYRTHWKYQYYDLYLAWWWLNEPKHVAESLIFNIDYQCTALTESTSTMIYIWPDDGSMSRNMSPNF